MKIKEVTNPEEQLGLLRVIIDNTWSAIKQQADAQARKKAMQSIPKPKAKAIKAPKPAPYPAIPKSIAKPIYKVPQPGKANPKPASDGMSSNSTPSLANNEKDDLTNLPRATISKPF
jgi:hypothetical protein